MGHCQLLILSGDQAVGSSGASTRHNGFSTGATRYARSGLDRRARQPVRSPPAAQQNAVDDIKDGGQLVKTHARKVRWGRAAIGKRGGIRVIYYWAPRETAFYMLYAYSKSEQGDLTRKQTQMLEAL